MTRTKPSIQNDPDEEVISRIHLVNGQKIVLDFDLAAMYGVSTKALNQAVKRNIGKFPQEFVFRLSAEQWRSMRSQIVTAYSQKNENQKNRKIGNPKSSAQKKRNRSRAPLAFTEHGVAMAANVLKSEKATQMSLVIVKTFIQLRRQLVDYGELAQQLREIRHKLGEHDAQLGKLYYALECLLEEKETAQQWQERERIGFKST